MCQVFRSHTTEFRPVIYHAFPLAHKLVQQDRPVEIDHADPRERRFGPVRTNADHLAIHRDVFPRAAHIECLSHRSVDSVLVYKRKKARCDDNARLTAPSSPRIESVPKPSCAEMVSNPLRSRCLYRRSESSRLILYAPLTRSYENSKVLIGPRHAYGPQCHCDDEAAVRRCSSYALSSDACEKTTQHWVVECSVSGSRVHEYQERWNVGIRRWSTCFSAIQLEEGAVRLSGPDFLDIAQREIGSVDVHLAVTLYRGSHKYYSDVGTLIRRNDSQRVRIDSYLTSCIWDPDHSLPCSSAHPPIIAYNIPVQECMIRGLWVHGQGGAGRMRRKIR